MIPLEKLDRELGLFSVCSIACGAMLSGLFVLPGYAYNIGGSSVYLAFLLAGVLFVPAALSKAEMATALPESGGDYIFIDRALGPVVSTITGLGTWLAIVLKSAFALVGLSAYLLLFVPVSGSYSLYIAVGIGILLVLINCAGVKKAGQIQTVLVVLSMAVLIIFVDRGSTAVRVDNFVPLFSEGMVGFVEATAFVFVSYAGLTKVASAAEEIRNPGSNIPLGIIISLVLMTLLYTLVVHVYVGVVPSGEHGKYAPDLYRNAPLSWATLQFLGQWGEKIMSIVAVFALASMANAGLLASSRYPLAMARYDQLPDAFAEISSRFSTPTVSILTTGLVMIFSILFLPVVELAKLASGFLLVIFGILNVSVIIFRESDIEWYNPSFRSPCYPYLQGTGILISLIFIPFLGAVTVLASVALILLGAGWYYLYASPDISRVSTLFRSRYSGSKSPDLTDYEEEIINSNYPDPFVLVPFFNLHRDQVLDAQNRIERTIDLFQGSRRVKVLNIHETSDVVFQHRKQDPDETDRALERYVERLKRHGAVHVGFDRLVTSYSHEFLRKFVVNNPVAWTVLDWRSQSGWTKMFDGSGSLLNDFPGNILLVRSGSLGTTSNIRTIVDPLPDAEQGFVVETAGNLAVARGSDFRVDMYFEGQDDAGFTERQDLLEDYFSWKTDKRVRSGEAINTASLDSVLKSAADNEIVLVNKKVAQQVDKSKTDQSATVVYPIRTPADTKQIEDSRRRLVDHLSSDNIYVKTWNPLSKRALFHQLARHLSENTMPTNLIEKGYWETEKNYQTYLGNGVCVPHALVPGGKMSVGFLVLEEPLEYSVSGEEASICITVNGARDQYRKVFSMVEDIGELSRDRELLDEMRNASESREIIKLLRGRSAQEMML